MRELERYDQIVRSYMTSDPDDTKRGKYLLKQAKDIIEDFNEHNKKKWLSIKKFKKMINK